jgi:alpha-beta hydrolase superfamily lysophospholipase
LADADVPYTVEEFTASDGYRWRYRRYSPGQGEVSRDAETVERSALGERAPLRVAANLFAGQEIVCIHGIQSHAGWYEYSCTRLAHAGYCVSFLDRRGAGMNAERHGDAPSFRRLIDDVAEFVQDRRQTARRIHLVAISWGGKVATAMQRRRPGLVDSLALLCPGFFAQVRPPLGQRLAIAVCRLVRPTRLFPVPLSDPELFTTNLKWLDFLRQDPLSLRRATARLLFDSVRLDMYLRFCPKHVRVPVLLMLAEKDRIIKNAPTRRFVERIASMDKTIIEYPSAHHTLEFESNPDHFIDDLLAWLGHLQLA